jgi:hypothetical protein
VNAIAAPCPDIATASTDDKPSFGRSLAPCDRGSERAKTVAITAIYHFSARSCVQTSIGCLSPRMICGAWAIMGRNSASALSPITAPLASLVGGLRTVPRAYAAGCQ